MKKNAICWLFCSVIDNFGDIGVSWRLARELSERLEWQVWLWCDDFAALHPLVPETAAENPCQGIRLRHWQAGGSADIQDAPAPDAVIEMFACPLPENVLRIIRTQRPLWLNWEYLSAEDWARRTHTMPSLQACGTDKYFWQMGFLPESGGLIREADYMEQLRCFNETAPVFRQPENKTAALDCLVFGYRSSVWADWFATLRELGRPMNFRLAGGQVADALHQSGLIPPDALRDAGSRYVSGCLSWQLLPFVPQQQFDHLLWCADMLWVRGEDSFVRAQFAGKPMFWHIYPQQALAHFDKLDAFWHTVDMQLGTAPVGFQAAFDTLSTELNGDRRLGCTERLTHWQTLLQYWPQWQQRSARWQSFLLNQSDTVSRLQQWLAKRTR